MNLLDWIAYSGAALAVGLSIVLAFGCLAVAIVRAPFERRRLGAWTLLAVALYLGLAWIPQRPGWLSPNFAPAMIEAPRGSAPIRAEPVTDRAPAGAPGALGSPVGGALGPPAGGVPGKPTHGLLDPSTGGELDPSTSPILADPAYGSFTNDPRIASGPVLPARPAGGATSGSASTFALALAGLWLIGALATLSWISIGIARLRSLLARSKPAPTWLAQSGTPRVRIAVAGTRAFCAGLFRPVIVLPDEIVRPGREAAARALLAHELAHVRAGDCRLQLCFVALAPLLWWQPLFWWLRARVRFSAELLADDAASRASSIHGYARELLEIASRAQRSVDPAGAVCVIQRPSEFYRRMQMLLQRRVPLSRSVSIWRRLTTAGVAAVVVFGVVASCGVASAQEPDAVVLRDEVAQLRATVATLRAEIATLRAQLEPAALEQPAQDPAAAEIEVEVETPPAGTAQPREQRTSSLAELLSVVNRTIELRGDVELAEAEIDRVHALVKESLAQKSELRRLEIRHRVTTQQLRVSELLLRSEFEHAKRRLVSMNELQKAGRLSDRDERLTETITAVRVLESVL